MNLPVMEEISASRDMIQEFGGYNRNFRIGDGEFYDMENLTGDYFPILSNRQSRGLVRQMVKPNGLFATDRLAWVDGTSFFYNGSLVGEVSDCEKTFVAMGAYLILFPDKKAYNTYTGEFFSLGAKFSTVGNTYFRLAKVDGEEYAVKSVGSSAPVEPANGDLWLDTSSKPHVLKQYSGNSGAWTAVPTTYVRIGATGIGKKFKEYDCVTISGCQDEQFNSDMIVWARGDDYIVVTGIIDEALTQSEPVTLERRVPDMDYVTQCNNRIWGCSSASHEIYACKLGDPTNWYCYMGLSSDSYAATIGSEGLFTGACTHLGYVLFFKDHMMHKVFGTMPGNYQVTDVRCRGVQGGSERSLVSVNEYLYYKSRNGVCRYDGSLPTGVSNALGDVSYYEAAAGAVGNKYYISMKDSSGMFSLFVYDTVRGSWYREDHTEARWFAYLDGDLYYVDQKNRLMCINGSNGTIEGAVDWYAESGDIGLSYPDSKYVSKIVLRLLLEPGAVFRLSVMYDSDGRWEEKVRVPADQLRRCTIPIIPKRCDHMRLRLHGTGGFKLYSLSKVTEYGSEV